MKFFTRNNALQKIIIAIVLIIVVSFTIPQRAYAGWVMSTLLENIIQLVDQLGDIAMGILNNTMLGTSGIGSAMLDSDDPNLTDSSSWLYAGDTSTYDFIFKSGDIDSKGFFKIDYQIPNMLYSPENIFANNIAALDINFLRQNTYEAVTSSTEATEKSKSAVVKLRDTVASWYKSFRNIAVVGLLSVLIYIGIRIVISSTAEDKAKYKENLKDWFVALCMIFVIHFIMSAVLMVTDRVTDLFATQINQGITVKEEGKNIAFRTNLMGLARFRAQSADLQEVAAYSVIYFALVIYTFIFTFLYFKRFLYMAFFTMIAPLVALTYPLDKLGDSKAQAFDMWFKEYTMNAIIQPVHLILYTVFVSSAIDLAANNPIYALVAIGFLIPAEKFIKKMFKLDKAESTGGLGSFAGGALAMKGLDTIAKKSNNMLGSGGKSSRGDSSDKNEGRNRIRTADRKTLGSFNDENNEDEQDNNNPRMNENNNQDSEEQDFFEDNNGNNQRFFENTIDDNKENNIDTDNNNMRFEGQEEMDRLGQQLDDYENNGGDIYSTDDPEIQAAQIRYQELSEQKRAQELAQNNNNQEEPRNSDENNNETPQVRPGYLKKRALRGLKKTGKHAYKAARMTARATATVGGGMIGLAAGITTGDPTKAWQYAVGGIYAGRSIGKSIYKASDWNNIKSKGRSIDDKVFEARQKTRFEKNEDKYGTAVASQMAMDAMNERAKKQFIKDKTEQNKYKEMAARIHNNTGRIYESKDLMNAAFDYKKAGITDEKQIERGLTLEAKHGGVNGKNHEKMVDVMDFAQTYKKDSITDEKKRKAVEGVVESTVRGEDNQREVMNLLAEAHGLQDYYQTVGKFGTQQNSRSTNRQSEQRQSRNQRRANNSNQNNGSEQQGQQTQSRQPRPKRDQQQ